MLWEAGAWKFRNAEGLGHLRGFWAFLDWLRRFRGVLLFFFWGGYEDLAPGLVRLLGGFWFFAAFVFDFNACSILNYLWF